MAATWKLSLSVVSLFPAETAVNIAYSCKLLDPDTRLLEWQELKLAMIQIHKHTHTLTHKHTLSLICVCFPLQADTPVPRPGGQFHQGRADGAVGCRHEDDRGEDGCGPHWTWAGKHRSLTLANGRIAVIIFVTDSWKMCCYIRALVSSVQTRNTSLHCLEGSSLLYIKHSDMYWCFFKSIWYTRC